MTGIAPSFVVAFLLRLYRLYFNIIFCLLSFLFSVMKNSFSQDLPETPGRRTLSTVSLLQPRRALRFQRSQKKSKRKKTRMRAILLSLLPFFLSF